MKRAYTIAYLSPTGFNEASLVFFNPIRDAKVKYIIDQGVTYNSIQEWNIETIDAEILGYMDERPSIINYGSLNSHYLAATGLNFEPNKNVLSVISRGHSQGDYAEIYYCPEDLETVWGKYPIQDQLKKQIDHLLWDCPVWARLTVNSTDYDYYECPEYSEYEWNRLEFLAWVSKQSGVEIERLSEYLAETPEYY